jgi:hypothetical protein
MEAAWWPSIADTLARTGAPWPEAAVLMDLRWWDDLSRMNGRDMRPGRPALCRRWAWTEHAARSTMADRPAWADPAKPDQRPPADRQRTSSAPPANLQPISSRPPADLQPTSSFCDESGVMMHPDRQRTSSAPPANLQPTSSRPPADLQPTSSRPPHAKRTQDTDTDTDTGTDTESNQPAGAGQLSLTGGGMEPVKPAKPTKAAREADEAARTFARLEALRLTRHSGGRGLSPARWVPEVRRALAKSDAQDLVDALVWVLHDPAAAFHRGEDPRSPGPDRTTDLALVLRHPEYALRRSWWGAQAPTPEELAEAEAAHAAGQPPPGWVERRAASPMGRRAAQDVERKRREDDEARAWLRANGHTPVGDVSDDDVCF